MDAVMFDSLEAARELEAAGVERSHAAAVVKTVVAATEAGRGGLATRADLAEIRADFARLEGRLEAKFAALETKFATAINRMVLSQIAVAGLLFAALKLF